MIIWISSYPKSGSTWVRLFLEKYLKNIKHNFHMGGFPDFTQFKNLNINYNKFENIIENWSNLQSKQNLNLKYNILKTHNALCTIGNFKFTDKSNTLGGIYLVRDPRDILVSYASHLGLSHEETLKIMLDPHASEIKEHEKTLFKVSIMGRWSDHYNSWKSKIGNRFIYIKYEDLVTNPNKEFRKILEYLKKLCNIEINEAGFLSSIENTKFEKLKKNEELNGFDQATGNSPFFRKGIVGDWKNNVDKKIIDKIENTFQREMKEIGYL